MFRRCNLLPTEILEIILSQWQGICPPQSLIGVAVCQHKNIYIVQCILQRTIQEICSSQISFYNEQWFQINAPFPLVACETLHCDGSLLGFLAHIKNYNFLNDHPIIIHVVQLWFNRDDSFWSDILKGKKYIFIVLLK